MTLRHRVFRILDPSSRSTPVEKAGDVLVGVLIVLNVAAVIAESVSDIQVRYGAVFDRFEAFSVAVFTLEYLARLWTCVEMACFRHPLMGRLRFVTSPMALLDLAVILPWYVPGITVDLRFVRILRLVRMLRVLKFARYSRSLKTFGQVFEAKRPDLAVVLFLLSVLVVVASSMMYIVENPAQPDQFSSIPAAMWWSVATLTTVGYGDIYPVTPMGKVLGAFIALIGIGFFALPAGLLASAFADSVAARRHGAGAKACPHCGKDIG